jgi:hypothetical protein
VVSNPATIYCACLNPLLSSEEKGRRKGGERGREREKGRRRKGEREREKGERGEREKWEKEILSYSLS